jgi:hypothetical protein
MVNMCPDHQSQYFTEPMNSTCRTAEVEIPAPILLSFKLKGTNKILRNIYHFFIQKALGIMLRLKSGTLSVDTDHYFVVAKVRERLAVSKRTAQKIDILRDSMSRNKMRGMLKNSIRLQSETSLHLWKT